MKNLLIFLMIIGFCTGNVDPDKVTGKMGNCATIQNSPEDLPVIIPHKKKYEKTFPREAWKLETSIFPDESRRICLSLKADAPIFIDTKPFTPTLVLRCKDDKTQVYIITGLASFIDQEPYGILSLISFDNGVRRKYVFTKSISGQAIFAPKPISLIRKMLKKKTMKVQFTSPQSLLTVVTFDVNGDDLKKAIAELQKNCHWN